MLSDDNKRLLLRLARRSIAAHLQGEPLNIARPSDPTLLAQNGAFVTLHRRGSLRGCIGHIVGQKPLFDTIHEMALAAALQDPRFTKVRLTELDDIDIEISILSPLERVTIIEDIAVGRHGLLIQKGYASGLLLPQVATEWKWDRLTFVQQTCNKAGLDAHAWMHPSAKIFRFEAEVFGEKTLGVQGD